jgi:hypothetical protein
LPVLVVLNHISTERVVAATGTPVVEVACMYSLTPSNLAAVSPENAPATPRVGPFS